MQQDEVCGHTLARTTHWALAWRKENFTHNGNGQSSRGEGGWGWSGKGLHLRNCERGADSLFWPGSTNSGNLSSSDSGVGGGASLRKVPRLAAKTTKKLPKVPSCFPDLLWLGADQGRQEGVHGGILSFQIVRAASLGR